MRILIALVVGLVVLAACSGSNDDNQTTITTEEAERNNALEMAVDMAVTGTIKTTDTGMELVFQVIALDDTVVVRPQVLVEFDGDVSASSLPELCEAAETGGVICVIDTLSAGKLPVVSDDFLVPLTVGAQGGELTLTVTSFENPVANDPDPENNVLVITAAAG